MTFVLLGLISHVFADFAFQSDDLVTSKKNGCLRGYLYHGLGVFLCCVAAFHLYGVSIAAILGAAITLVHILVDWLKNLARRKLSPGKGPGIFAADQLIHVITILAAWNFVDARFSRDIMSFYRGTVVSKAVISLSLLPAPRGDCGIIFDRVLVIILAYAVVIFAGPVIVRQVLDAFFLNSQPTAVTRAGKYIGIVERTFMLTLVLVNAFQSLGFVLTAKSLARFSELNDMKFAEYYLVGTLTSATVALLTGIGARWFLKL
ncbi:MAG: DUF3307 domain-containing protein [Firmicutes bacterium]|nr:DUF3307 domain-containing protein [Bacillota bacterium]